jgi:hypothetical protein
MGTVLRFRIRSSWINCGKSFEGINSLPGLLVSHTKPRGFLRVKTGNVTGNDFGKTVFKLLGRGARNKVRAH